MNSVSIRITYGIFLLNLFACGSGLNSPNETKVGERKQRQELCKQITFRGKWWSENQLSSLDFNPDNPPEKKAYVQIEQWNASSGLDFPNPDIVDVYCHPNSESNISRLPGIEYSVEARVADYEYIVDSTSEKEIESKFAEVEWTKVLSGRVDARSKLESDSEFLVARIEIRDLIKSSTAGKGEQAWPWFLRISLLSLNPDGSTNQRSEAILELIPAD